MPKLLGACRVSNSHLDWCEMLKPLLRMPASFYVHCLVDAVSIGLFVSFAGVVCLILSH
jgi:hypothetical protein